MENIDSHSDLLAGGVAASRTFLLQLAGPWSVPVAVALGGWERCAREYLLERRRYPFSVLEIITGGKGSATVGGKTIPLEPGVCFAVGPRTACRISTISGNSLEKYFLALAGAESTRRLRQSGLIDGASRRAIELGEIRELAELLIREGRAAGRNSRSICSHLASAIIEKIGEQPGPPPERNSLRARRNFEECRRLMDAQATRWKGLGEVAASLGMNSSSICRLFRRFLGISPHQYLIQKRMGLAATLLIEPGATVQRVALQVGMEDPFHFSRLFRTVHGVAPSTLIQLSAARGNNTSNRGLDPFIQKTQPALLPVTMTSHTGGGAARMNPETARAVRPKSHRPSS
ncbi:MAG: hypothetical protein Fur0032_19530 [Terrimicrobiaceae bacterium]